MSIIIPPRAQYDADIAKLRELQNKYGIMPLPDIRVGVKLVSAEGEVLVDRVEQGHSWTRNGWNLWNQWATELPGTAANTDSPVGGNFREGSLVLKSTGGQLFGTASIVPVRASTNGTPSSSNTAANNIGLNGAINNAQGIVVGGSAEPFSAEDFCMWSNIAPGSAAGQLVYDATILGAATYDSGTKTWTTTHLRQFNNNSGGSITVNEIGLTSFLRVGSNWTTFLLARDVLSSPVAVANGAQLTITYTFISATQTSLESAATAVTTIGAALYGGRNIGPYESWGNSPVMGVVGSHPKYLMVVSPLTNGDTGPLAFRTTLTALTYTSLDTVYGKPNTDLLIAQGLGSALPALNYVSTQNAANLGGFNDWYMPTQQELANINAQLAALGSDAPTNAFYWHVGSFGTGSTGGSSWNPVTALSSGTVNINTTARVRLIRRHKL